MRVVASLECASSAAPTKLPADSKFGENTNENSGCSEFKKIWRFGSPIRDRSLSPIFIEYVSDLNLRVGNAGSEQRKSSRSGALYYRLPDWNRTNSPEGRWRRRMMSDERKKDFQRLLSLPYVISNRFSSKLQDFLWHNIIRAFFICKLK